MKFIFSILLVACSACVLPAFAVADVRDNLLVGNYDCISLDSSEETSQLSMDDNGAIRVVRGDKIFQGTLSDRSNFLLPIEKEAGLVQFLVLADNGDDAPLLKMFKLKDGRVLIEEFDSSKLQDRSQDASFELEFQPDVVCTSLPI